MQTIEQMLVVEQEAQASAYRMSGKRELERAIIRMRDKADMYEALLKALPELLPNEADEALWRLALLIPDR